MSLTDLVVQLLSGMTTAATLFMVATGLTLVFGAMRVINFAHGSFYMIGAFLAATVVGSTPGRFWLALLVVPLAMAALGAVTEMTVLRRIYGKEHLTQLLATFAVFLILADLSLRVWGGSFRSVPQPDALAGTLSIGGSSFPVYNVFVMAVAALVGLALWFLLQRTTFGFRIRAAAEDTETLATTGTHVGRLFTVVFALSALLAGLAGATVAPLVTVAPGMDVAILVDAFIVAVIGGLGSVPGAALGAVLIGLLEAVGVSWAPSWASAFTYLAMIAVLIVRPWGLLGTAER